MKNIGIVIVAIAALIGRPAFAADMAVKAPPLPAPVAPSWTGLYFGVNAGAAWLSSTMSYSQTPVAVGLNPVSFGSGQNLEAIGGFQVGYNYQFSSLWVAGVEGDFDFASIANSPSSVNNFPGGAFSDFVTMSEKVNWLATARGKLGFLWGSSLWYATGGVAWDSAKYNGLQTFAVPGAVETASFTHTNIGWVAGGGAEWMFAPHWLMRAEYLYYGFPSQTASVPCTGSAACGSLFLGNFFWHESNIQTVRAAISYKF